MSIVSGARLRALREENGETQLQISQLLGFKTKQAYSAVEAERDLSFENLIIIAKHFGVTTDYITGASPYRTVKEEQRVSQAIPGDPHDPATVDAFTIIRTAEFLQKKYQTEGTIVRDKYLRPLAELCDIMKEQISSTTYRGDAYRKVNEACQTLLKKGF